MEFCKILLLLSLWTKSYGVTIQMKPLNLYFHIVLLVFKFYKMKFGIFYRILSLATFGSEKPFQSQE